MRPSHVAKAAVNVVHLGGVGCWHPTIMLTRRQLRKVRDALNLSRVGDASEDLRSLLPLLEHPRSDASIDELLAARLVAFGANSWSDWWASKALDWVDQGVWSAEVSSALKRCAADTRYSQITRDRAWRHVKPAGARD